MPVEVAPKTGSCNVDLSLGLTEIESRVQEWLAKVGLSEPNLFQLPDAGADPDLNRYLVRHEVFRALWQNAPTLVFATAGGGKSAFRVRLAHACRVEEDGRHVFPIVYIAPQPDATTLEAHLITLLKKAARELFLALVWRPRRFLSLTDQGRAAVRGFLDDNDPGLLQRFLPQVERAGGIGPLVESFDPSASRLGEPPSPYQVRALCAALEAIPPGDTALPPAARCGALIDLLLHTLGYESIFLLVDSVDAWPETQGDPRQGANVLTPLLQRMADWAGQNLFLKLFLPLHWRRVLPAKLTKTAQSAIITWDSKSVTEVLRQRLRAASRGRFDSLDAISAPSLRGAEEELLLRIQPDPTPRELLALVNRVIIEHVLRDGLDTGLEPSDVDAAIRWYQRTRARPSSP